MWAKEGEFGYNNHQNNDDISSSNPKYSNLRYHDRVNQQWQYGQWGWSDEDTVTINDCNFPRLVQDYWIEI